MITEKKYRIAAEKEEETEMCAFRKNTDLRFILNLKEEDRADSVILRITRDEDGEMFLFPMMRTEENNSMEKWAAEVNK